MTRRDDNISLSSVINQGYKTLATQKNDNMGNTISKETKMSKQYVFSF